MHTRASVRPVDPERGLDGSAASARSVPLVSLRTVVGRDQELAAIDAFLERSRSAPGVLLIEGEPGAGKTALLEAALDVTTSGVCVLWSRPVEAETRYAFSGLADLLGGVAERLDAELPEPQRHAIRSALLLERGSRKTPDHRAVGAATLSILRRLADDAPVVVAIDDLHWLDHATARALAFALRRLRSEPVALLASRRSHREAPSPLDEALRDTTLVRVDAAPLSVGALERIITDGANAGLPRTTMLRIHHVSRGNPLFALELVRALGDTNVPLEPGQPLPVPEDLQVLLLEHLGGLSDEERDALLLVALLAKPTEETLTAAIGRRWDDIAGRLRSSGIIDVRSGHVWFTHPLRAAAVANSSSLIARQHAHRRLAGVVTDAEQRARHLALATSGPDEGVATVLEEAAIAALRRGAPDATAELAEMAAALTPDDRPSDSCRRWIIAGDARFSLADHRLAEERFVRAETVAPPGRDHADALLHVGRMRAYHADIQQAMRMLEEALVEAEGSDELTAVIESDLAMLSSATGDTRAILRHAHSAARSAERAGLRHVSADAHAHIAAATFVTGDGLDGEALRKAVEFEDPYETRNARSRPSELVATLLSWADRLGEARTILERCERETTDGGLDAMLPFVWYLLSELDCWTGDWRRGLERALEADKLASETDDGLLRALTSYAVALLAAHLGDVDESRKHSKLGADIAIARGAPLGFAMNRSVFGFLEASLGRPERAVAILDPLVDVALATGMNEPAPLWFLPELIESLVHTGDLDRATSMTEWLEERARAIDRARGLAGAARCRGLLASAHGRSEEALGACAQALVHHERIPIPFERARTLLVGGQIARRSRKWGVARECLDEACEVFERLGAALWLERAQNERERIGGRKSSPFELTESERQVAELAAAGRSNKEIADVLFLSPKTVGGTLGRVYRKLGVRTRTELSSWLARADQATPDR